MTGLYIVLGILGAAIALLLVAVLKSNAHKWKLRSPFQTVHPKKKRRGVVKKKKLPIVQITFNKR
jgi:hypothetical protein